jgi:hypothetical protein
MMNWKGCGRKLSQPKRTQNYPGWTQKYHTSTSVRIASVRVDIRTDDLPNTSHERYHYANPSGGIILNKLMLGVAMTIHHIGPVAERKERQTLR